MSAYFRSQAVMTAPPTLPAPIRSLLSRFVVRHRWMTLIRNSGYALVMFALWMLIWCLIDRLVHLPALARGVLLAAGIGGFCYLTMRAFQYWLRHPDWVAVAERIERDQPLFGQKLITVTSQILQTPDHRGSDQILSCLAHEV